MTSLWLVAVALLIAAGLKATGLWSPDARGAVPFVAAVVQVGALLLAILLTWVFFVLGGMGCDETCDETSLSWHRHRDAWQWDAVSLFGFAGLALTVAAAVLTAKRRTGSSWFAWAAPAACYVAAWTLYSLGA